MPSVVTFARMPEEEGAFVRYLSKSGDVWARAACGVTAGIIAEGLPVAEFFALLGANPPEETNTRVALGFKGDVLSSLPLVSDSPNPDIVSSCLLQYSRGLYHAGGELAQCNVHYYSGFYRGEAYITKPDEFLRWGKRVLSWVRRRSPKKVRVHRCNYDTRATNKVYDQTLDGLLVGY